MAKAHATWKVLPHAPIEKLSERLWRVEGQLPGMPMKRSPPRSRPAPSSTFWAR